MQGFFENEKLIKGKKLKGEIGMNWNLLFEIFLIITLIGFFVIYFFGFIHRAFNMPIFDNLWEAYLALNIPVFGFMVIVGLPITIILYFFKKKFKKK